MWNLFYSCGSRCLEKWEQQQKTPTPTIRCLHCRLTICRLVEFVKSDANPNDNLMMGRGAGLPSFQSNVISIPAFQFDQGIILSSSGKEEEAFGRGRLLQLSQHKWANQSPPQVKSYLLKRQRILVLIKIWDKHEGFTSFASPLPQNIVDSSPFTLKSNLILGLVLDLVPVKKHRFTKNNLPGSSTATEYPCLESQPKQQPTQGAAQ